MVYANPKDNKSYVYTAAYHQGLYKMNISPRYHATMRVLVLNICIFPWPCNIYDILQ